MVVDPDGEMTMLSVGPPAAGRDRLRRRIRWIVAATISYNAIEAIVAITAGTVASSTALVAFGLDSIIEVSSAAAVAWQFSGRDPEAREKTALRIIAVSFLALALYVTVDAVRALTGTAEAEHSTPGLVLAALSLAVMPFLSYAQRRAGRELGSASAVADSKQTLLCTYLSAVLLAGLALNTAFGWSWADPVAALVIAAAAVKEGRDAWRGDACCAPPTTGGTHEDGRCGDGCAGTCCVHVPSGPEHEGREHRPEGNIPMSWAPTACTLPTSELPLRVAEFDQLFTAALREVRLTDPRTLRLALDLEVEQVARDLAARETACCSFFTFTFTPHPDALRLDITVPAAHTDVLAALAARATACIPRRTPHPRATAPSSGTSGPGEAIV